MILKTSLFSPWLLGWLDSYILESIYLQNLKAFFFISLSPKAAKTNYEEILIYTRCIGIYIYNIAFDLLVMFLNPQSWWNLPLAPLLWTSLLRPHGVADYPLCWLQLSCLFLNCKFKSWVMENVLRLFCLHFLFFLCSIFSLLCLMPLLLPETCYSIISHSVFPLLLSSFCSSFEPFLKTLNFVFFHYKWHGRVFESSFLISWVLMYLKHLQKTCYKCRVFPLTRLSGPVVSAVCVLYGFPCA